MHILVPQQRALISNALERSERFTIRIGRPSRPGGQALLGDAKNGEKHIKTNTKTTKTSKKEPSNEKKNRDERSNGGGACALDPYPYAGPSGSRSAKKRGEKKQAEGQ